MLDPQGHPRPLTLVGIVDLGAGPQFKGWSVLALTDADLATLTQRDGYASIVLAATPGTDPQRLRRSKPRLAPTRV